MKELIVEGVVGIVEGLNPKLIRSKLEAYLQGQAPAKAGKGAKADAARRQARGSVRRTRWPERKNRPHTKITSAGWFPMRTSSPCCSLSLW